MAISSFMSDDKQQQPDATAQAPASNAAASSGLPSEETVRQALLDDVKTTDLNAFLDATHNSYSADLQVRGQTLTKYLQREQNSPQVRGVYLDPNEYTALEALHLGGATGAAVMMGRDGLPGGDDILSAVGDGMHHGENAPGEGFLYSQDPHAVKDLSSAAPQAAPIVPSSAYFPPSLRISGLSHEQNIDYINRHEGWHMADVKNLLPNLNAPEMKGFDMKHPEKSIGNPAHMAAVAMVNRQESFADVGAAGDMIREGADSAIIGKIIAWRQQSSEVGHMTAGALEQLQKKINDMGLDKFRALDDDSARALYEDAAVKGSLQPAQANTVLRYSSGTPAQRAALEQEALRSPETKAALDFTKPYLAPHKNPTTPQEDQALSRQLSNYHPADLLKDRAFTDAGKITPVSLARAYGQLQDELRQDLDRDPDNRLWQGQANKLQQTFINVVNMTDYIGENARRGVDIFAVEPALKGLASSPAAAKTSEAAPLPRTRPNLSM